MIQSLVRIVLGVACAIPLVIYPYLYFFQEKLLFLSPSSDVSSQRLLAQRHPGAVVRLTPEDGVELRGWLIKNRDKPGKTALLIYFGGNAEEVSGFVMADSGAFLGWSVLAMNYRGYGESRGQASEKNLFSDARSIFDWAVALPDVDGKRIVAMGRSLGTGVAVHLADRRPVAGVVLVSPYDSIRSVAQEIYPYVPVGLLLKHPFDSLARAPAIHAPMLALLAGEDVTVPSHHAKRLIKAWGGPSQEVMFPAADHNSITGMPGYFPAIRAFLASLTRGRQ